MTLLRRIGLALFAPVLAVVVAVVISSLVMAALQVNPLRVFEVMVNFGETPTQQVTAIVVIINRAIPLFLAGLAVAIAFRMGLFNIGVEGQYRLATIMAAAAGAAVSLPGPLHLVLIVVVAMLVGAFWAGIVAVLKVTRGVSEVISSIMLNFIALGLASYLLTGPFRGTAAGTQIVSTKEIPESGWVPSLNGLLGALGLANPPRQLYGFAVIAIVVGVLVAVLLNRTRFGFDLRASGLSPSAASASGVDARGMVIKTMLLSGAVAGLIGLPDLLGAAHAYTTNFTAGLGFLGIAVALLGRNRPGGIALAALLFSFLDRSLVPLQIANFPASVITIFQGTIVLAVVIANEIARRVALRAAERGSAEPTAVAGDGSTGLGQGPPSGPEGTTDVRQGAQA
ncbi:MAG: ABC transporter permease [Geodermatophilales bacterium]|nr:ABC transporter permease [Geodermatophilales bacterium]